MSKKEDWDNYFKKMDTDKANALIEYQKLCQENVNKTYLQLLPVEFSTFKRSIIKRQILQSIASCTKFLNEARLHGEKVFTEKDVTFYMLYCTKNTHLANCFIPRRSSMELFRQPGFENLSEEEQNIKLKPYYDYDHHLQWLKQSYEAYESQQRVKAGLSAHVWEKAEDVPRTSRGNLCSVYTAVDGVWQTNKTGQIVLKNPRTKKNVVLQIEQYVKEDNVYICHDEKNNKIYLASIEDVKEAWSCLFDVNKEIFSGWWNRTLIWK